MPYKKYIHTITVDNCRELAHNEMIEKDLDVEIYFARPYSFIGTMKK